MSLRDGYRYEQDGTLKSFIAAMAGRLPVAA